MAETDSNEMATYKSLIEEAGCQLAMDPAIIAGIMLQTFNIGRRGSEFVDQAIVLADSETAIYFFVALHRDSVISSLLLVPRHRYNMTSVGEV